MQDGEDCYPNALREISMIPAIYCLRNNID